MSNATTAASFQGDVLQSDLPVLVDFWADWCAPCRMLAPTVEQIAEDLAGKLRVFKVDVDAEPELANRYGIQGIPTLILFAGGQPRAQAVGVRSKHDLLQMIERALGVTP